MIEGRKTIDTGATAEITEKKSRFIGAVVHISSEEEALSFLESERKKYYDARHHCLAFLAGDRPEVFRSNDDGEPGGSAGRPILDVLTGAGLHDTACVVTRYFGGTLLGVGGLIRAYSSAAAAALAAASVIEMFRGIPLSITANYTDIGKMKYLLSSRNIPILGTEYKEDTVTKVIVPSDECEKLITEITELTNGKTSVLKDAEIGYGFRAGKLVLPPEV